MNCEHYDRIVWSDILKNDFMQRITEYENTGIFDDCDKHFQENESKKAVNELECIIKKAASNMIIEPKARHQNKIHSVSFWDGELTCCKYEQMHIVEI